MSAIEALEHACEQDIEECTASCASLKEFLADEHPDDRALSKCIADCEAKLAKLKKSRKNFGLELTQIKDRTERNTHAAVGKGFDESISEMGASIQKAKMHMNKMELVREARTNQYSTEGKTNDELLDKTNKIQDLTFDSLGRTKMLIEQSKEVGTATVEELRRQRVQIKEIEDDVDVLDSHLDRAEKLVSSFARRMASDKLIQGFMVLNIVIIICIAVYAGVTGKTLSGSSKSSDPNLFGTHRPSVMPTALPTLAEGETYPPTYSPTCMPSLAPLSRPPTMRPSPAPTATPSFRPTAPTAAPTVPPTNVPTAPPTAAPTPTDPPTQIPTIDPTTSPIPAPSLLPSPAPSPAPSLPPTVLPTPGPTFQPSTAPTPPPSQSPSQPPSAVPTF